MQIKGKTALVTGGARRLGHAFALALAQAGANVAVHFGSSEKEAAQLVWEIRKRGVRTESFGCDLSDTDGAAALIGRVKNALGSPSFLINSAAIFEPGTLMETTTENWQRHIDINLTAPFLLSQAFARSCPDTGKIVNIADWRALFPGKSYLAYTIAKAGLLTLTEMSAQELAPRIQVNALALGAVLPPPGGSQDDLQNFAAKTPAGRPATLDEITGPLLFLLDNDFITGETLMLDGGAHLAHE